MLVIVGPCVPCPCAIPCACLRSLLACLLCCDCQNPLHPPDLDIPLPSSPSTAPPPLTPQHGAADRPRTTLPGAGEETPGDRGSVAGLSCSTLTPSEGMDVRRLLRTPRRRHRALCSLCPRVAARLRRMNLSA